MPALHLAFNFAHLFDTGNTLFYWLNQQFNLGMTWLITDCLVGKPLLGLQFSFLDWF